MVKPRRDANPSEPYSPTISPGLALKRLQKLLDKIPEIRSSGHNSPELGTWQANLKIVLSEFYGENSLVFREFSRIWFSPGAVYAGQPAYEFENAFNSGLDEAQGFLKSRIGDLHGRKETVARFLGKLGLEAIILHEQADQGKTLIEKFVAHAADVHCAVVILTSDDIASPKTKPEERELRARQNVILELGFFVGKLGREHTFALVEKGVTLPSDIHGVVYISLENEEWRLRLVKELKAAGVPVDANLAF